MNKKHMLVLAFILLPALILVGCNGAAATSPAATTPPVTSPTTTSTTPPTTTPTTTPPPTTTETSEPTPVVFTITSTSFEFGEDMPAEFGLYTGNKSPQLSWSGAPEGTVSFAIIMEDTDATWFHWLVFNIPADVFELEEGQPFIGTLPNGAKQGMNSFLTMGYGGTAPPPGTGIHHYYIHLYALDTMLDLWEGVDFAAVYTAIQGHILGQVDYMGTDIS